MIRNLREQFDSASEVDWHLYSTPNWTILNKHGQELRKKLDWLKHLSDTKFKHWPAKGKEKEEMTKAKRTRTAEYKKSKKRRKREKRKKKRLQKRIDLVKEENLVFNLINPAEVEVPDAALAVLSYGEGFVPTPKFDDHQFRLEAHNASNKLERLANTLARESRQPSVVNDSEEEEQQLTLPKELRYRGVCLPPVNDHHDPLVTQVVNSINQFADNIKPKKPRKNLSTEEQKALSWLRENTKNGTFGVLQADKGGAKVLLSKDKISSMIKSKLGDSSIYTDLGTTNSMPAIMTKLRAHWVKAVNENYISLELAKEVVGITDSMMSSADGKPSTLDIFKPGTPFFNVFPKVHKLRIPDLVPGVKLPFRLVTNLSKGPTSRADKFIAVNFLSQLQLDYCTDLIQDSTMFLQKLDHIERTTEMRKDYLIFNMDVEALYDSIKREQVEVAIRDAIQQCRPDWDEGFIFWLLTSVNMSLDAAVAKFGGRWYQSSGGVATGGKLCVYVANIVVYWAFNKVIYSQPCRFLVYFYRYIDDGTGGWSGEPVQFFRWFCKIYKILDRDYNLRLTFNVKYACNFLEFLDVNYRFVNTMLDTDIFYKETDAHRYLSFKSTHPHYTFKSVAYSSFLRLKRIIIDHNLLEFRLSEMSNFLSKSDYPTELLNSVRNDVICKTRSLSYRNKDTESKKFEVGWVVTFGPGYGEVKSLVKQLNNSLTASPLFPNTGTPALGVVAKRAPSLRDILFSQRDICLNTGRGSVTTRCTPLGTRRVGRPCESCDLMSEETRLTIGQQSMNCAGGDCKSFNLNYCAQCSICNKAYIGKTVQQLGRRISQHRGQIQTLSASTCINRDSIDDTNTLAAHAIEHNVRTKAGFNSLYKFFILKYEEKEKLTISEQFFINKFRTYRPYGLNTSNPISVNDRLILQT